MRRNGLLIPAIGLLAAFLGWKCYEAWTEPFPPPPRTAGRAADFSQAAPPAGAPQSTDLSAAVTLVAVRPVFRPDRKIFEGSAAAVPQRNYDAELRQFTVLGILGADGSRKAIVTGGATGKTGRFEVGPGESIPGFTVKEVRENEVLVVADGREFLLPLYAGGPKVSSGQAPARTDPGSPRQAAPAAQPLPAATAGSANPANSPAGSQPAVVATPSTVAPPPAAVFPVYNRYRGLRQRFDPGLK